MNSIPNLRPVGQPKLVTDGSSSDRPTLKIHNIDAMMLKPNGDRYTIEVCDFDETLQLGQLLVVTPPEGEHKTTKTHPLDPIVEQRGVIGGIILRGGNGHLLGLPDAIVAVNRDDGTQHLESDWAAVPMFFEHGDVVLVDRNAKGRALKIIGHEYRVVNQIDILLHVEGIKAVKDEDGKWQIVEAPVRSDKHD